ncbi:AbrB/MazE/SpoVT family DNA-binding domain-containing protein [Parafannyhessea umbonata]|jgi:antitoxin PrlF|uniref:Looped-hinge helix DNA binding domain-containing protein, AbrB family n=1 Tax=Parafannyhessea umbonata TaxID=604330 RepID=A0A1H1KRE7_9ACTN|nr:AbrB/MazE/SpoVT family DNA-binding domain-containing protein [Parafannyhessea umbonata]SDR64928.1 looped-hinge helix DNA binding domain-containing protein, AbrB family [Parafannyhessea umbonata]
MSTKMFVDNAKVMSKGQITIPKDVRKVLGVDPGDKVTFIVEGNVVRVVNAASYAMQVLQSQMLGTAESEGILSEEDVADFVTELRSEA